MRDATRNHRTERFTETAATQQPLCLFSSPLSVPKRRDLNAPVSQPQLKSTTQKLTNKRQTRKTSQQQRTSGRTHLRHQRPTQRKRAKLSGGAWPAPEHAKGAQTKTGHHQEHPKRFARLPDHARRHSRTHRAGQRGASDSLRSTAAFSRSSKNGKATHEVARNRHSTNVSSKREGSPDDAALVATGDAALAAHGESGGAGTEATEPSARDKKVDNKPGRTRDHAMQGSSGLRSAMWQTIEMTERMWWRMELDVVRFGQTR